MLSYQELEATMILQQDERGLDQQEPWGWSLEHGDP